VLVGDAPATKLPTVRSDGTPVYPGMPKTVQGSKPAAGATGATGASGATGPAGTSSGALLGLPLLLGGGLLGRRARRHRRPRAPDVRLWSP
jgi:LPXTG-motif cell wall-anchored protein